MPSKINLSLIEDRARRFGAFRRWLSAHTQLGERPRGDAVARAKRVERALREMLGGIDLDAEYARDRLEGVLESLEYSIEDVHNHRPPPAGIVFRIAADDPRYYEKIREGLSSLRNAVGLYRDFCDDANPR